MEPLPCICQPAAGCALRGMQFQHGNFCEHTAAFGGSTLSQTLNE